MSDGKLKNNNGIDERLRKLRFDNSLTQAEVAHRIGVTQQTYSKYEGGNARPDSSTIIKLCELYGVTADYLLGLDEPKRRVNTDKLSVISENDVDAIVNRLLHKLKNEEDDV